MRLRFSLFIWLVLSWPTLSNAELGQLDAQVDKPFSIISEETIVFPGESVRRSVFFEKGKAYVLQGRLPDHSDPDRKEGVGLFLSSEDGTELLASQHHLIYYYSDKDQSLNFVVRAHDHTRGKLLIGVKEIPYGGHSTVPMEASETWQEIIANMGETVEIYPSQNETESILGLHMGRLASSATVFVIDESTGDIQQTHSIGKHQHAFSQHGNTDETIAAEYELKPGQFLRVKMLTPGGFTVSEDLESSPSTDPDWPSEIPDGFTMFSDYLDEFGRYEIDIELSELDRVYPIFAVSDADIEVQVYRPNGSISTYDNGPGDDMNIESTSLDARPTGRYRVVIRSNEKWAEFSLFVDEQLKDKVRDAFVKNNDPNFVKPPLVEAPTHAQSIPEGLEPVAFQLQAGQHLSLDIYLKESYRYLFVARGALPSRLTTYSPKNEFSFGYGSHLANPSILGGVQTLVVQDGFNDHSRLVIENANTEKGGIFFLYMHPSLVDQVKTLLKQKHILLDANPDLIGP